MQQLTIFGLSNVHKEPFPFGAGWLCNRFSLQLVQPFPSPLFGFPLAWSSGTSGPVVGDVTLLEIPDISSDRAMEAFKLAHCGNLKGKILIHEPVFDIRLRPHPFESTISDEDLIRNLDSRTIDAFATVASPDVHRNAWRRAMRRKALCEFAAEEGALAVILQGRNLRLGSVKCAVGYPDSVNLPPQLAMTGEHYNRIRRLTDLNIPVSIELDMQVRFTEDSENAFNVVAELPGANGNQEFVMLGAHLDSWHTATGATDNAAGCAVAIEAFRVLRKLNVPLQRTVRLVLWSGHEQGGAGSKAYVNQHFGDWQTKAVGKEHSQLYAYFNVDSGGGKIRALSIQGNQMMKPIVERWLVALRQVGVVAVDLGSYRGMDMRWFEQLGLPVIQFWQEGTDLHNMIRETNMDVYDRLRPRNLAQASAAVASVIYMAANEPEPLPRKPLPWQV
jgi:hypothetical protein